MKNHIFCNYAKVIAGVLLILFSVNLLAEPSGSTILEDVFITDDGSTANIHIIFSCKVRYITHFPQDKGDMIRIKLEPLLTCDTEDNPVFQRESIKPEHNEIAMLDDVAYENEIEVGSYLNLHFQKSVLFEIRQSSDFRSINVIVHQEKITQ